VSRLRTWAAAGPEEPPILTAPRRDTAVALVICALTAVVFVTAADHGGLSHIQRLDDSWLRLMISGRAAAITAVAKVFNVLGLVYVTLPARIAIAGYLAFRRWWWHLAAFAAAVLLSEVLIGPVKAVYDRARPPESLVATSGASFPSGHSIAASVTVFAAVIALVPAGRRRVVWGLAAALFALLMGLSRAYLGAHWLSDSIAGLLLGTSCALLAAVVLDRAQRDWRRRHEIAETAPQKAVRPADQR
jgi:membrane-associated phospholipid phosphatase